MNNKYIIPSIDLLEEINDNNDDDDISYFAEKMAKIEQGLMMYGVAVRVVEVNSGPIETLYEMEYMSGQKLEKLNDIEAEIKMILGEKKIKLIIPIPGTNRVGIQVPSRIEDSCKPIKLRDIITKEKDNTKKMKLPIVIGKNEIGKSVTLDLIEQYSTLISGVSGSGKTQLVNAIIMSLLMTKTPEEVRLGLIDTKGVDLVVYNGIPHLICPVINDTSQSSIFINKIELEAKKRFNIISSTGNRTIDGYNDFVENYNKSNPNDLLEKMPYIIVVIDEISEIMQNNSPEGIQSLLEEIFKYSKTTGIYIIMVTDAISNEIISERLKSNINMKISFVTTSADNSRTNVDSTGAEKLHSRGEMLIKFAEKEELIKAKEVNVSDNEIYKVIECIKNQNAR